MNKRGRIAVLSVLAAAALAGIVYGAASYANQEAPAPVQPPHKMQNAYFGAEKPLSQEEKQTLFDLVSATRQQKPQACETSPTADLSHIAYAKPYVHYHVDFKKENAAFEIYADKEGKNVWIRQYDAIGYENCRRFGVSPRKSAEMMPSYFNPQTNKASL